MSVNVNVRHVCQAYNIIMYPKTSHDNTGPLCARVNLSPANHRAIKINPTRPFLDCVQLVRVSINCARMYTASRALYCYYIVKSVNNKLYGCIYSVAAMAERTIRRETVLQKDNSRKRRRKINLTCWYNDIGTFSAHEFSSLNDVMR